MAREYVESPSRLYQTATTAVGLGLWCVAGADILTRYALTEQLSFLALVPLIVVVSMFVQHLRLPSGLKFTDETFNFTLADTIVLLVACWHGLFPAIFIAGVGGFSASLRTTRRWSSNLFSAAMLSLAAAAASLTLNAAMGESLLLDGRARYHTFLIVALALLAASLVQMIVNIGLLSLLLALRHHTGLLPQTQALAWTLPMFLPTATATGLLHLALQHSDVLSVAVLGAPALFALYLMQRRDRQSVQSRIQIMEKSHRETIEALAVAINAKDQVTHEHVLRVQIYAAGVARLLGCAPIEIEALKAGALLHDIGKIAVPDYILNKPGKLTSTEFDKMKMHTLVGAQILSRVEFPYPIVPIVRHHHERWDGKGYPDGLQGEGIPLTARILSVVDCFDAVREDRQYRRGLTREEALELLMEGVGTQYDPRVVGTFITHLPEFEAEILAHRDTPLPTFGIEPVEQLSEEASRVAPAAGLAEAEAAAPTSEEKLCEQEERALAQLTQALEGLRDANQIVPVFTAQLRALVPYETCAVTLAQAANGEHCVVHAAGQQAEHLRGRRVAPSDGVTGWVLTNRQPFCNTDPKLDFPPALAAHFAGYRTLAVFPINRHKENYGAVSLYSSALSQYSTQHQRLLEAATTILAAALAPADVPLTLERQNTTLESKLTH